MPLEGLVLGDTPTTGMRLGGKSDWGLLRILRTTGIEEGVAVREGLSPAPPPGESVRPASATGIRLGALAEGLRLAALMGLMGGASETTGELVGGIAYDSTGSLDTSVGLEGLTLASTGILLCPSVVRLEGLPVASKGILLGELLLEGLMAPLLVGRCAVVTATGMWLKELSEGLLVAEGTEPVVLPTGMRLGLAKNRDRA